MPLGRIEHFLVLSDDIDATRDWYERALGLSAGERPPLGFPGYWLYSSDGVPVVHVADRSAYEAHTGFASAGAVDHIAFRGTNYEAIRRGLDAAGVSFLENEIPGVMRQLFVEDPAGVRLELNVPNHPN